MAYKDLEERMYGTKAIQNDDEINKGILERKSPEFADNWPKELDDSVRDSIVRNGVSLPYRHQAKAISRSLSGHDVVMESPTASGKTLAFTAPMLHTVVRNPNARAMMIYPMKALSFDQCEQVNLLCERLGIKAELFDRDTPRSKKKEIKSNPPNILLTNPENLNMSFLGWREQWPIFLKNLEYIVIDEMHEYRGYFGGNMALLLRRLRLYLKRIGASPRFFLSSATCANSKQHATQITGREAELVLAKDALRPRRHFHFIKPNIPDGNYWDHLRERIERAALAVLEANLQTIVFCPSKHFLEEALRNCKLQVGKPLSDSLAAYHADLPPRRRRQIQKKIGSGDIRVVFATSALELGVDIGSLDGVIMAGFPSTTMSAWQQIGRAGRSWDSDAFVYFYAMNDPIDRHFVSDVGSFLNRPIDHLAVDPNNQELIKRHLSSLVHETQGRLRSQDKEILGPQLYKAAAESRAKLPRGRYKPQSNLNLRGGTGQSYELRCGEDLLGQIPEDRRFREAYIGAIFTLDGRRYYVRALEKKAVILEEYIGHNKTVPQFFTTLQEENTFEGWTYGDHEIYYGSLRIQMNFNGYRIVDERSDEIVDIVESDESRRQENLHAMWINTRMNEFSAAGIGGLEHILRIGTMFVIPADRSDSRTLSKAGDDVIAYHYESYPGGIGVSRKLFEVWDQALIKGIEIAEGCTCLKGCQNCIVPAKSWDISNPDINKLYGMQLAKSLMKAKQSAPNLRFDDGVMVPV